LQVTFLILFLAGLVLLNYRIARSVLYPPFIFTFMWLMVFCVYQTGLVGVDPLHPETLLLVGAGALLYTFGGGAAELMPRILFSVHANLGPFSGGQRRATWSNYLVLALCFIGMVLVIRDTFALGALASGGNVLARARAAGVQAQVQGTDTGISSNPLSVYTPVWSALFSVIFLLERKPLLFWTMASISFIASLFTTGRGPIIMLFCSVMAAFLLRNRLLRISAAVKVLRIPFAVMVGLYVVLIFTNKDLSTIGNMGVFGIIIFVVGGYFVSPVAALDYVLQNPAAYAHEPNHTFKFFLGFAAKLHLINYQPPPLLDSFITVPFATNVYTGYKFFYTDFGVAGCVAIVAIIGFLHTLLYRKAETGSKLGMFFYCSTVFPIVMFIFDDLYSAFGEHLDILAVGFLYFATRSFLVSSRPARVAVRARLPRMRFLPRGAVPQISSRLRARPRSLMAAGQQG
jgi:oligosaccharide repeat unit polymerase